MASVLGEAAMVIRADDKKLKRGLSGALGSIKGFAGNALRTLGPLAAGFAGIGGGLAAGAFLKNSLAAYQVQEKAVANLTSALHQNGDANAASLPMLKQFASELQSVTTQGDEATLQLAAYLSTISGMTGGALKDATKETLGLARATGQSGEMMGRAYLLALQGNFTALQRYIPALRDATTDQEKMAIVSGLAAKGLGQMESDANTSAGAMQQMRNAVGDFQEMVGSKFAPVVTKGAKALKGFIEDNGDGMANFVGRALGKVIDLGKGIISFLKPGFDWIKNVVAEVGPIFVAWGRMVGAQFKMVFEIAKAVGQGIGQVFTWIGEHLGFNLGQWGKFKDGLITYYTVMETAFANWKSVLELGFLGAWKAGVDFWDNIKDLFGNDIPALLGFMADNWKGIFVDVGNGMVTAIANAADEIGAIFSALWTTISTLGAEGGADLKAALLDALDPSDLLDGFQSSLPENEIRDLLKVLGEVEQSELSKSLADQIETIKRDLKDDLDRRLNREDQASQPGAAQPGAVGGGGMAGDGLPNPAGAMAAAAASGRNGFVGLQDRYRQTQEAAVNRAPEERAAAGIDKLVKQGEQQKREVKQGNGLVGRIVELLEEGGGQVGFGR